MTVLTVNDGIVYVYLVNFLDLFVMPCFISVERILKAKTVAAASPMAPACGLYLGHVKFDPPSDM